MAKKKRDDAGFDPSKTLRGLTISLFVLLLAFFIVLNALGQQDDKRMRAVMGSLRGTFSPVSGGISLINMGSEDPTLVEDPMATDISLKTHKIVGLDLDASGKVYVRNTPEGVVVGIPDEILFIENTINLKPSAHQFLMKLADIINDDTNNVIISGHTDSRPPEEKNTSSNWENSSLKALSVLRFFVERGGVLPTRVLAYGYAEYRPVSSNETRKTRELNRRIDITLDATARGKLAQLYEKRPSSFFLFQRFVFDIFGG